ncbi:MAG: hypothetical protein IPL32_14955 [Chloracidobacterium sp.]|nr:hypothetical protein [Chloracidobacterium sp.]
MSFEMVVKGIIKPVLSVMLLCYLLPGCISSERFVVEKALGETRSIRDAQKEFKKSAGRFGTIDELFESRLISSKPGTGMTSGFEFRCEADVDTYQLSVTQKVAPDAENKVEIVSFFVDQSGIVRVSVDPKRMANSSSYSVSDSNL